MEEEKVELNDKIIELENEKEGIQSDYEDLAKKLANPLCCKQKIDKWEINYYSIVDDNVICLETGDQEINCHFS